MKVLMFGWEFPPQISGGLGIACYELSRHLVEQGVEISFCMPKAPDRADAPVQLIDQQSLLNLESEKKGQPVNPSISSAAMQSRFETISVDVHLTPYMNAASYLRGLFSATRIPQSAQETRNQALRTEQHLSWQADRANRHSHLYGTDLFAEVQRYAQFGGHVASQVPFDLIHGHDWMTFPACVRAAQLSAKPLILHVHALEKDRAAQGADPRIVEIERQGLLKADQIIAVSERTRQTIIQDYGVAPNKVRVVYNGICLDAAAPENAHRAFCEKTVLFLGRITLQKGPDYFVEAARLILEKYSGVRFVMAGTGDMLPMMIRRVAEARLQDRFHFTQFLDRSRVFQILKLVDLYVMPSVSEPFGIAPLEALSAGVPVIISHQSGVAEILHNAIKIDFWDTEKLAASIVNLLVNDQERRALVELGKSELPHINWRNAAESVNQCYKELARP